MLPDWGGDDRMIILIFLSFTQNTEGPQSGFDTTKETFLWKTREAFGCLNCCNWRTDDELRGGGDWNGRGSVEHTGCVCYSRPSYAFFFCSCVCVKYIFLFAFDNVCLFVCEIWLQFLFIIILRTRETCETLNGWMHIWYGGVALISFLFFSLVAEREREDKRQAGEDDCPSKPKKCVCVCCVYSGAL